MAPLPWHLRWWPRFICCWTRGASRFVGFPLSAHQMPRAQLPGERSELLGNPVDPFSRQPVCRGLLPRGCFPWDHLCSPPCLPSAEGMRKGSCEIGVAAATTGDPEQGWPPAEVDEVPPGLERSALCSCFLCKPAIYLFYKRVEVIYNSQKLFIIIITSHHRQQIAHYSELYNVF